MAYFKNLLLLDDDEIDTKMHRFWALRYGLAENIIQFTNPEAALVYIEQSGFGSSNDLMLIDIHMPLMSGLAFIQAYLSKFGETHSQVSIYILTSSISQRDSQQAAHLPLKGYLVKPLQEDHLKQIIERVNAL
jgi:CheY-like chemotaxis protein